MSSNDSIKKTITVAFLLCVVCSILVSSAAVFLKPLQEANKQLDRRKNILLAAGLYKDGADIDKVFADTVTSHVLNLETGSYVKDIAPEDVDETKFAKDPKQGHVIPKDLDIGGIKRRSKLVVVYEVQKDGQLDQVVLPVHGKGLWSTLYGFLAVAADGNTVRGLGFYQHGETPGLGGEVDNPRWKALWPGKKLHDDEGNIQIEVLKGMVNTQSAQAIHQVDGLSGATITAKGVSSLVRYWIGIDAYGKFLKSLQSDGGVNG